MPPWRQLTARKSAAALCRSTKHARAKSARVHLAATGGTPILADKRVELFSRPRRFWGRLAIKHNGVRKSYRGGRDNPVRSSRHNVSRLAGQRTPRARAYFGKNAQTFYSAYDWRPRETRNVSLRYRQGSHRLSARIEKN